jgi:GNAT superfamily N-acetyltransferase
MRHERALLKPRRLSGLETPEFGWERFHAVAHELPVLFTEHWKELALNQDVIPLSPDWDKYYRLDIEGVLRILTVRMPGGQLVGYIFLMAGPHLHYATTLWGHVDMFYLDPVYRQGWTGVRLFKTLIADAKTMGIVNLTLATKTHFMDNRVTKLLQRLGFMPIETIHAMRLL